MSWNWLWEPARIRFCEAALAGPIKHPADTWTNVGPLIAGVCILVCARRPQERLLGAAAVWTAVASGYFHASNTVLGETLDLSGMFAFIFAVWALQANARPIWALAFAASLTVASAWSAWFASPAFAAVTAWVLWREWRAPPRMDSWASAVVGTFAVAWSFWWLDYLHLLCAPNNHLLTGHGVWHLLNGLVFWFVFLHYREARVARAPRSHAQ